MMPSDETANFTCRCAMMTEYLVDNRTFAVCVAMFVYSQLAWVMAEHDSKISHFMSDRYHQLRASFYGLVDKIAYEDLETGKPSEHHDLIIPMSVTVWSILD